MKSSLLKLRLYVAGVFILLCSGLAWATMVRTNITKPPQPSNVESKPVLRVSAGELAAPAIPDWSQYAEDYVADGTTVYYLYNVGCEQFVTAANSWATQISLGTDGLPYMSLVVEPMSVSDEAIYPGAVKLKLNGAFIFWGTSYQNGRTISHTYLFRDTETSGYIDRNKQAVWYWNFEKNANGTLAWHSAYGMGSYDAANQYAKCEGAGQPVLFNGTSEDSNNEWMFIPYSAYQLYKARIALYDKLMEAVEYGISTDNAVTVYNKDYATIEALQEAYNELSSELTILAVLPLIEQASEENPIDITQYTIENPDFENGQSPWTITDGMGQNLMVQGTTYNNGDVKIQNFIEAWYPIEVGSLKNGVICQTVAGLPEGRYRIEADVIAVRQEDGFPKADQQGIYLFFNNGEYTIHSESLSTDNGLPEHFTFDFDYSGAEQMTIGLMAESTNCNWMGMDNFRLYSIGQMQNDPARQALEDAIASAETIAANIGDNDITATDGTPLNASTAAKSGFIEALTAAKNALEAGSGYQNAIDALVAATYELNASAEIYAEYQAIWQNATEKQEWLTEKGQWPTLAGQIAAFANNIFESFNSGTLDDTALANMKNAVDDMIAQYIATEGAVQPGDDLTIIIKNADFSEGGGQDLTGTDIPSWNIVSGSITELSAIYHNIEAYHRTFDVQQTLAYNLPAGTYRITVQGYVRVDRGNNSMVLYAGASERKFKLITDENSETQICGDGTGSTAWPYDVKNPVLGGYMPYSMQGAMMYFETINPVTEKPYYLNDVTISHTGGNLTIGVKCDDTGLWVIWDNFTLEYVNDNPLTPIFDDIDALTEELTAMLDNYTTIPDELIESYTAVMARVNNKESITSMEDAYALIDDIQAVIQLATREPYVRITTEDGIETLTFYYGKRTSDALELAEAYGNVTERAWNSDVEDIQKVVFDSSFGDYRPIRTFGWFYGMINLTDIEGLENLNTSNVTTMRSMFYKCSSLTRLDVSNFDTSNVTDMSWMFYGCTGLTSIEVSNFDTSNVKYMGYMFYGCSNLTNLDVSNFNTDNVTDMSYMFYDCSNLTNLDVSHFNTSNVTDIIAMFYDCSSLTSLDVSQFNTDNVTDMGWMFYGCSSLTSLDVSNFDTRNVTFMRSMFCDCSNLTNIDVSHFNTDNVTDIGYMFYGCSNLTNLDVSLFNTSNVTNMIGTFYNCSGLTSLDVSYFNTDKVTDMRWLFYGCSNVTSLDVSHFNTSNVTDMKSMFNGCSNLTYLDVSSFDTSNVTDMGWMFYGCSRLTSLDVSHFNTGNVTNMSYMFSLCSGLTSLDVSNFNTSTVTDMRGMFWDCSALTNLDVSNFNTSKVADMREMFGDCVGLSNLDVSGFNTSNVTDMRSMFFGCSGLTSLDISSFNTNNVTNMGYMFYGCSSLATIYVGDGWSTDTVDFESWEYLYYGDNMFFGCTNLVGGKGTAYNEEYTDVTYAHIDGGADNPGYFTAVGEIATGIDGMEIDNAAGAVYDLGGRRVGNSTSDIRHSRKGIYVINGKKTVIR